MAKIQATRGAQYPLTAEFVFGALDTMKDSTGADKPFSAAGVRAYDAIMLPQGAVILSGSVTTETAVSGATAYKVSVGDATNAVRYLASTEAGAADTIALVPTGAVSDGSNVRVGLDVTGTATAGKVSVRLTYVIRNRVNEVQTH